MVWGLDPGSRTTPTLPLSCSAQLWIIFTTSLDLFFNAFIGTPRERTHDGSHAMSSGCSRPPWSVLWSIAESCCWCASVLCYKVGARECHASLAHVLATNRMASMILWRLITAECFQLHVDSVGRLSVPLWLQNIADSQPNPLPSQSTGAKAHIEDVCHDAIIMPFYIFFPLSLPESLSLKGPSALLLPAFNHWVVKYLIPIKIPFIVYLPATCSQRLPSKPPPWGEHWDLLDYFSAREWKHRWLLFVFFPPARGGVLHL